MFRQILVPLDGSTFAEAALPVALSLRRSSGARLHLVTVHEPDLQIDVYGLAPMAAQWSDGYLDGVNALREQFIRSNRQAVDDLHRRIGNVPEMKD